jgi:hypothetical protein
VVEATMEALGGEPVVSFDQLEDVDARARARARAVIAAL